MQNDQPGPTAATGRRPDGQSFDARFTDLVIRLIVVGFFAYLSLTLLAPFAIMVIWAVILAVALYPAFAALRRLLGGRGGLAATLITLLGLVIIVVPLGAVTVNVAETTLELVADFENQTVAVPRPPESVREWPVIGEKVHAAWSLASVNLEAAVKRFGPAAAAGGRRDRRQDRGRRLRHARIRRVGAGRRLSLRPRPAAGRGRQDLRPPHRRRARGALRRPGRSDDPQHLARRDRRRRAPGAAHRPHPDAVRRPGSRRRSPSSC